jgi:DNA polymerase-4
MLIRLAGVGFSHLVGGGYQINLFEDSLEQVQLYQTIDRLKNRYGDKAVMRAAGMGFQLRDFNPFNVSGNHWQEECRKKRWRRRE